MNNKEYRAKLDEIETYHSFDILTPEELKELRADMKTRRQDQKSNQSEAG